jgi:2'-5' RNA ligase
MSEAQYYRLFVAVIVPEAVKDEIAEAQDKLREAVPDQVVRWTKREHLHLTLKFLGNVGVQKMAGLADALTAACGNFAPLDLRAESVGFFPSQRAPRVVWVGVQDAASELLKLQQAVELACSAFSLEKPENRFSGHITLGRIKGIRRTDAETLTKVAETMKTRAFGQWKADHIEVIRSELSPRGARYTSVHVAPLSARSTQV